jgi:hypothetical protein
MASGFVIAADQNDGSDPRVYRNTTGAWTNGSLTGSSAMTAARSTNHKSEVITVLKVDASASGEESTHVGIDSDNIYTSNWGVSNTGPSTKDLRAEPGVTKFSPYQTKDTVLVPVKRAVLGGGAGVPAWTKY